MINANFFWNIPNRKYTWTKVVYQNIHLTSGITEGKNQWLEREDSLGIWNYGLSEDATVKHWELQNFLSLVQRANSFIIRSNRVSNYKLVILPLILDTPMDGGAWWAAVHGVAEGRTWLSNFTFTFHFHELDKKWQPTPVFLLRKFQWQRSPMGCSPWDRKESYTPGHVHMA